jgi:phosphoribosylformimino-5-aminoimidazole carboxamide ribotide isomerase
MVDSPFGPTIRPGGIKCGSASRGQQGLKGVSLRILPVLDVMGGIVVRGVGGRREEYRPIVSRLTDSTWPLDVARAFRDHFGLDHLYVADLDAIGGQRPALGVYAALHADGFRLAVDAGVRQAADGEVPARAGVAEVVAGLETIAGPEVLRELCRRFDASRLIFSLDLKEGRPLGDLTAWHTEAPLQIVAQAVAIGIKNLIVLDLADVGSGRGVGTHELCGSLIAAYPGTAVMAGGGIRHGEDLKQLKLCGVSGALVASALHDGRLSKDDL